MTSDDSLGMDPLGDFRALGLGKRLLRGVAEAGFLAPTPIQAAAIPPIKDGRDLLALARTGTGKTAAFALPLIDRLMTPGPGPRVLVLAPTRELCQQIQDDFLALGQFTRVHAAAVFGGVPSKPQEHELKSRPPVLVAAPGRLLDLHARGHVDFAHVEVLVVDEADRLFDMGFLPNVRRIIDALPPARQTLLFSATMPDEVRALCDDTLRDPVQLDLASEAPPLTITHELWPVHSTRKADLLDHVIRQKGFRQAIVFCSSKDKVKRVHGQMLRRGHRSTALQGDMSQRDRDRSMASFREGAARVMIATDIAARGLDVERLSHVVNYDVPRTAEIYVHRTGRTGRSGASGTALTFAAHNEFETIKAIEDELGTRFPRRKLKEFQVPNWDEKKNPKGKPGGKHKAGGRSYGKGFGGRAGGGRKPKTSRGARRRPS